MSDLHLIPGGLPGVVDDLAAVIRSHAGHELVLNGDTFSLSAVPRPADPLALASAVLGSEPALGAALRDHLARGDPVTLTVGNHDAALTESQARARLVAGIGCSDSAPLSIAPWFIRRGKVQVEHGHLYDPDNAPLHPLAPWRLEHEPLGVALTRRLVARLGAEQFAHAHETTLVAALLRAIRGYGRKAPRLIATYYFTAAALFWEAGRQSGVAAAQASGRTRVGEYAREVGLEPEQVERMLADAPPPTHQRRWATFRRLYLDRSLGCLALLGAAAGAPFAPALWPALVGLAGCVYLAGSVVASGNRYAGLTERRLRAAAVRIAEQSSAGLVVFGHSHVTDCAPGYINSGSFGVAPPGCRPYLVVDTDGRGQLERL